MAEYNHLPEEAIGLPAGLLQTGLPGVVGSLWKVGDIPTALLMTKFYEFYIQHETELKASLMLPAKALHKAQLWLKNITNDEMFELLDQNNIPEIIRGTKENCDNYKLRVNDFTLDDERPFAHPYYWASFAFYGA
jgi:CHAT domain-containing protein